MQKITIWSFSDYHKFLKAVLSSEDTPRGFHQKLASAADIHSSYLSQVLAEKAHLTPEHALGIAEFLDLTEDEIQFFLLLVDEKRASSERLKKRIQRQKNLLQKKQLNIGRRLQSPQLKEAVIHEYYRHWLHQAVRILVSIPKIRTTENLARHLNIPYSDIQNTVKDLVRLNIVQSNAKGEYVPNSADLHIERSDVSYPLYMHQWRLKAFEDIQRKNSTGFHYTSLYALSKEDAVKLREMMMDFISKTRKLVEPSQEETAVCFLMDLFDI